MPETSVLEEIKNAAELILPKREIELAQPKNVFGRSDFVRDLSQEDLDYVTNKEGGRYHFMILRQDGIYYIQDEDSTNGTELNDIEIKGRGKKELKNGDRIKLAGINNFTITFKQEEHQIPQSEQLIYSSEFVLEAKEPNFWWKLANLWWIVSKKIVLRKFVARGDRVSIVMWNGDSYNLTRGQFTVKFDKDFRTEARTIEINFDAKTNNIRGSIFPSIKIQEIAPMYPSGKKDFDSMIRIIENMRTIETVPIKADKNYRTAGTLLKGKYKIVRLLKSGGMGFVYEGEYDGKKCIIKEAKPGEGIKESNYFLEKIKIEAEVLSKVNHDNIVRYIDSFVERNSFSLVEEYVEGDKVGDKYYSNPGSEDEVISNTLQLLNAVQYIHKKQIKHRDINPNNLILTPDKKLVLIDFGTAKYMNKGRKETQGVPKSTIVGTSYYAPPEQWEGDTSEVSDIFSIGRTMYFMLTGENPTENPYKRLDFIGKNVTKELADFVIKAAEPEIKDRYESVDQMISLLNKIKDHVGKMGMNTRVIK